MVRMGWFVDEVGEKCKRCPYAQDCLATGYSVKGDEKKQLEKSLRVLDSAELFDGIST
jgi:hypothetical protein